MLFCKQYVVVVLFLYLWIDGIFDNYIQQDSQGQGVEFCVCNGRDSVVLQGDFCNDGVQSEFWYKMLYCMMMIL